MGVCCMKFSLRLLDQETRELQEFLLTFLSFKLLNVMLYYLASIILNFNDRNTSEFMSSAVFTIPIGRRYTIYSQPICCVVYPPLICRRALCIVQYITDW